MKIPEPNLTAQNLASARKLLLLVTSLLDKKGIPYYLEGGTLLFVFFGHRDAQTNLFLIGTRNGRPDYGQDVSFNLSETSNAGFGGFDPATVVIEPWGNAVLRFSTCDRATLTMTGVDGTQTLALERLTGGPSPRCD